MHYSCIKCGATVAFCAPPAAALEAVGFLPPALGADKTRSEHDPSNIFEHLRTSSAYQMKNVQSMDATIRVIFIYSISISISK